MGQNPIGAWEKGTDNRWTGRDYILTAVGCLVNFIDAIEIYLPGVVNQIIACDIGLSKFQEGWLAIIQYITMGLATLVAGKLSDRFHRRHIVLASLYASIVFNIFSALIHNYPTLLLSRALIGICVGLNGNVAKLLMSEGASSPRVSKQAVSITSIVFTLGAGWVAVVGYFLIEPMGWRIFLVSTSIPLIIPCIALVHFCSRFDRENLIMENLSHAPELFSSIKQKIDHIPQADVIAFHKDKKIEDDDENTVLIRKEEITDLTSRTIKASLFGAINFVQGHGSILLLPSLISYGNEQGTGGDQECAGLIHGTQYLIIALISGGANTFGRICGFILIPRLPFKILQPILAVLLASCYGFLLLNTGPIWMEIIMAIIKIGYSMMVLEGWLLMADTTYFGTETIDRYSAIAIANAYVGSTLGTALAIFLEPHTAVLCTCVISVVQILVVWSMMKIR